MSDSATIPSARPWVTDPIIEPPSTKVAPTAIATKSTLPLIDSISEATRGGVATVSRPTARSRLEGTTSSATNKKATGVSTEISLTRFTGMCPGR